MKLLAEGRRSRQKAACLQLAKRRLYLEPRREEEPGRTPARINALILVPTPRKKLRLG